MKSSKNIGSLKFFCRDLDKTISIRNYLKKLLTTLLVEQDEFSGKRPFGNSGWIYDIMACLISHKIIPGVLDDEGCVIEGDDEECIAVVKEYIETM